MKTVYIGGEVKLCGQIYGDGPAGCLGGGGGGIHRGVKKALGRRDTTVPHL